METMTLRTMDDRGVEIADEALEALAASLRGSLLTPDAPDYDRVRAVWNAMIDRRPGLIVRCAGAADVVRAVTFARDREVLLSVRGGGHNIAGSAVCDGGLMIDLSPMQSVQVDPPRRTARVEPGVTLAGFDNEAQAFGLATPLGINSTTGVAGLTLGGGFGWLSRKYGLTIDNLLSADAVTAEGHLVKANGEENADLFWGLRGGGGNFGIVTSFEFQLHPVGPEVLSGLVVYPFEEAGAILRQYRGIVADMPEDFCCWVVLRKAPPLPFLPAEVHGKEILVLAMCHAGSVEDGLRKAEPFRHLATPIADVVSPHPFTGFQAAFDPLLTPGVRNYWKSHDFSELSDAAIDTIVEYAGKLPTPQSELFLAHLGGAINRVPADATAYPHRGVNFTLNVHTRWENPAQDEACLAWAREFFDAAAPYATGGVYVNFLSRDEGERIRAAYGANYDRLVALKTKYDPMNIFRCNQNIRPDGSA